MTLEIFLPVLLSAFLHATWNALVRAGRNRIFDMILVVTGAGLAAASILVWFPLPQPESWPYLIGSTSVHLISFTMVALAYRVGDLSLVYPLMRGTAPALTAIFAALILTEWPKEMEWLGVGLVSCGVLLLAADARSAKKSQTAVLFALTNAGFIVLYTLIDGMGVRRSGNAISYTAWMLFLTGIFFFAFAFTIFCKPILKHLQENWIKGIMGGGFTVISYTLATWAMGQAPLALVAALRETSIVFGTLIAVLVLKERISRLRIISIAAITTGAFFIKGF